jgi:GNAT superfamily N-acetyltransferase
LDRHQLVERPPTVEEYRRLRRTAGWDDMTDEGLATGLSSALYSCVLLDGDEVVACGRVVGDGGMYFYVQDVIVAPEHRGRGLGAQVMSAILDYVGRAARPGAFVGLMAAEGVEGFYERYGFQRRPDDRPGMSRVW